MLLQPEIGLRVVGKIESNGSIKICTDSLHDIWVRFSLVLFPLTYHSRPFFLRIVRDSFTESVVLLAMFLSLDDCFA